MNKANLYKWEYKIKEDDIKIKTRSRILGELSRYANRIIYDM